MLVLIKNRKYFASCVVFDTDFTSMPKDIYDEPRWPDEPCFMLISIHYGQECCLKEMESVFFSAVNRG
jgi:hypothetical protein